MKKFDPTQLSYFTGTEKYYQRSDATPFGQTPPLRQNRFHVGFFRLDRCRLWVRYSDSSTDFGGHHSYLRDFFWITRRYMRT